MKKLFFALALGLAVAVSCTPEYDDSALKDRMDQIEEDAAEINSALAALMERIEAAEKAIAAVNAAAAAEDYVVSVLPSEDGKGVVVTFRTADPVFIPLDLDAEEIDEVVIASVEVAEDKETATFTYTDGTEVVLPLYQEKEFALVLETTEFTVVAGATTKVPYTVTGATEETVVDVLATSAGYVAVVTKTDIEVTVPSPFVKGDVLVWADNGAGKTSIKKLTFFEKSISVEEVAMVPAAGGNVEIKGVSNVEVSAEVVEGADWLTAAPAAKAEFSFTFVAAANEGAARTAEVALKAGDEVLYTVTVAQAAKSVVEHVWTINVPFAGGVNRNMATDGEYLYVAQAGAAAIKAISLADTETVVDLNVEGVEGGLLAMSCVRVLENNDPAVNNGKPVVLATNLSSEGANLTFYLWKDGIDKAPSKQTIGTGSRRLGDKFTVRGTYQSGALWFWDFTRADDAMVRFDINNGVFGVTWDNGATYYASGRWAIPLPDVANSTGEVYAHPDATFTDGLVSDLLVTTNISDGYFKYNGAANNIYELVAWTEDKDPELDHAFGFNFFEYNGKNYIAYIKLINERKNATINIIEDVNGAADFKGTLEAKQGLATIQLLEKDGTAAQNGVGDCVVFEKDGVTYVAGMLNNNVISLYKFI